MLLGVLGLGLKGGRPEAAQQVIESDSPNFCPTPWNFAEHKINMFFFFLLIFFLFVSGLDFFLLLFSSLLFFLLHLRLPFIPGFASRMDLRL